MKRSNWLPIIFCLIFVIVWEKYVVHPYAEKHKVAASSPAPATTPLTTTPATSTTKLPTPLPLSEAQRNSAVVVPLSGERSVRIFQNGSIGAAEFRDYRVRGKSTTTFVTMITDGFHWTSTDPTVSECLNKLSAQSQGLFTAKVGGARCTLRYSADPSHAGLIHNQLDLSGFNPSGGLLEFRGIDTLGEGTQADHNYLHYKIDGSRSSVREKSLYSQTTKTGKVDWLSWGDKYFSAILIPRGNFNPNVVYGSTGSDNKKVSFGFQYPLLMKQPGESLSYNFDVFVGTRDTDELSRLDPTLVETVDLGFFGAIARLMLGALKIFNKVLHNFGLSIIALTLVVRFAFWPLNKKVFASGLKMKTLQPEIERLKAKYAGDKNKSEAMNREMMALYKRNKVNPVGSCLPLLLQTPIFFGLYGALNHSLDLYQAPFFGWLQDLSSPDPFYILPFLWTLTLVAYSKLNPTTTQQPGAPDMKWIMIGMNIFFGFLSKDWPAGLTLYLFVSNLVGISQQLLFQRAAKLQPIQEGA